MTFLFQFVLTPGPVDELPVKVPPLLAAIRSNRYVHVKELYIWDVPMKHEDTATLVCIIIIHDGPKPLAITCNLFDANNFASILYTPEKHAQSCRHGRIGQLGS